MAKRANDEQIYDTAQRQKLASGAEFFKFDLEANKTFVGKFLSERIGMREDLQTHEKKEGIIGYDFVDHDGVEWIIGDSYSVRKSLNADMGNGKTAKDLPGVFEIEFLGKIVDAKGKPFNRFDVWFTPDK